MLEAWRKEERWLLFLLKTALVAGVIVLEAIVLLAIGRLLL